VDDDCLVSGQFNALLFEMEFNAESRVYRAGCGAEFLILKERLRMVRPGTSLWKQFITQPPTNSVLIQCDIRPNDVSKQFYWHENIEFESSGGITVGDLMRELAAIEAAYDGWVDWRHTSIGMNLVLPSEEEENQEMLLPDY